MQATLLVELLSEELPPKPLGRLGSAFAEGVLKGLRERGLVAATEGRFFATPRRLAAQIGNVLDKGEDRDTEVIGPSAKAPAQAVAGFAKKHGIAVEQLERRET
ncbi:MAG: glycine--tRNA ligase subunit beta, partial [Betaproteobacteria bacterium]